MRALLYAVLAPLLACATPGPSPQPIQPNQMPASDRARVDALLAQDPPPAPESWKQLGPQALTWLRQVAGDPAETPTRRTRAIGGMAGLDDPDTGPVLQSFATDGNGLPAVRAAAALSLSAHDGPKSAEALKPLLADGNAEVRFAAARALGNAGGDVARAALQSRLDAETDPKVRDELQKSLAKLTN